MQLHGQTGFSFAQLTLILALHIQGNQQMFSIAKKQLMQALGKLLTVK